MAVPVVDFSVRELKIRYSEKATKIWLVFHFFLHYLLASKYNWKIGKNFVAFSEYLNFKNTIDFLLKSEVLPTFYFPKKYLTFSLNIFILKKKSH